MKSLSLIFKRLIKPVDLLLDRVTSYRLVLYFLITLVGWAFVLAVFGKLPYDAHEILISVVWLVFVCRGINILISRRLNISTNNESDLITALILVLILTPATSTSQSFEVFSLSLGTFVTGLLITGVAASVAMASKYLLSANKWHIFNPAAVGAFTSSFIFSEYASWWVGTKFITPVVFIGGMLILRKMKRFTMVIVFEVVALSAICLQAYLNQSSVDYGSLLWNVLVSTNILFFGYIMLTEPLTSPRYVQNYVPYAMLVGFLYGYSKLGISPEEALLIGNLFTYIFEPNKRIGLTFKRKIKEANGIESFVFSGKNNLKYRAGQYMEWTIENHKTDSRGNRRYLTISSSPTEKDLMVSLKVPPKASSFKQQLERLQSGQTILASQISGTFTLPKSEKQKLAFLAGGIGITPFRSMIKYTVDFEQQRDIQLLYSATYQNEFAFKDLFEEAKAFGVETTYATELVDKDKIQEQIPDYQERIFYISGPYGFVNAMEINLLSLGLPQNQIKTDYFPGYDT